MMKKLFLQLIAEFKKLVGIPLWESGFVTVSLSSSLDVSLLMLAPLKSLHFGVVIVSALAICVCLAVRISASPVRVLSGGQGSRIIYASFNRLVVATEKASRVLRLC